MRQADVWEPPDDSTIGAVASRIVREQTQRPPNLFHFDSDAAHRGRTNAGRTAHAKAVARKRLSS
jgi:hypothetical protein